MKKSKREKVVDIHVRLDSEILEQIDTKCRPEVGLTRSLWIRNAIEQALKQNEIIKENS